MQQRVSNKQPVSPKNQAVSNRFLAKLSNAGRQRLMKHMEPVYLAFEQVLYHATEYIEYVYFPFGAVLSALAIMQDGASIEVATVGNEGLAGHFSICGPVPSPNKVIVQVPGNCYRIKEQALHRELNANASLLDLMGRYQFAFMQQISQTVACNGLHSIEKRCCRWLLMTRDRVGSDEINLTHEYLGVMLGIRRASVSTTLKPLQTAGLLATRRGTITILNAEGLKARACECYKVIRDVYHHIFSN